jgi:hypothetical protein
MKKRPRKPRPPAPLSTSVPSSWTGTPQEWRECKRSEWSVVVRALDKFTWGSAYVPAGDDLYQVQRAVARITEAMNENWVLR